MDAFLTEPEVRVLGCLVEKEITTPEYYPLSLNSLTTACNQKTNREPVVAYTERTVAEVVESLRDKNLAILATGRNDRATKYDNYFADTYHLSPAEAAVMCVLMLRGPQTPGEIKSRTERLFDFKELAEVEAALEGLAARESGALVVKLPRQPGRKEHRYLHLLCGPPSPEMMEAGTPTGEHTGSLCTEKETIDRLEQEIIELRGEMQALREQFAEFKNQFE